jgi:Fe-S-cluster-containing hydrogenase component 2
MSPPSVEAPVRPEATAPSFGDVGDDPIVALKRLDLFRGLTDDEYQRIAKVSSLVRVPQDRTIPRGGDGDEVKAFYFLLKGQVAFAQFDKGTAPRGPVNPKKRVQPIMQIAKKNVALFEESDFFANDHVSEAKGDDGTKREMALYTCVPVVMLKIPRAELDEILAALPKIKEAVEQRAEASYYRQTFLKVENRHEILDFYVKQGFEYAQAIKVIQTDKCIDCDNCIKACEDRHGVSRIERFGPKLGLLQFTQNCRTCHDARCLEPCNFDAIGYDQKIHEVIVYDNCVGCTLCAKACPHEAIRMVDIIEPEEEVDIVQIAAEKQGKKAGTVIAAGEEKKAKKKKPKRIANKCDHCLGYSDLACISACPTGAIIQIDPRSLFRRDGGLIDRAEKYFDPAPFEQGYSQATRSQGVTLMLILFTVCGVGVAACFWEYFARKAAPELSLWRQIVSLAAGDAAATKLVLTYGAVAGMGRWMGYIGSGMMVIAALYTLRLNLPGLRKVGNSKTWFDFHVVFGIAGPLLSLLHTDFHVFSWYWVTLLWWAVFLVVVTGLIGRYLYTAVPKLEHQSDRARKQLDEGIRQVADQWGNMTMSANVMQQFLKAQEKTAAKESEEPAIGAFALLGYLFVSEVRRIRASIQLRFRLLGSMKNRKLRRAAIRLMSQRAVAERRAKVLVFAKPLLAKWRAIHIGITIVMFVLLVAHVAISIWAMGL